MSTGFLQICSEPIVCRDEQTLSGTAAIDIRAYDRADTVATAFLILEGCQQFAVRLGQRALDPEAEHGTRVLPASLKGFRAAPALVPQFHAAAHVTRFQQAAVVNVTAVPMERTGSQGVRYSAQIIVTRATFAHRPRTAIYDCPIRGDSLLQPIDVRRDADTNAVIGCSFAVRSDEPLLAEHFPGNPIVPGSLLVEFIWWLHTGACEQHECADAGMHIEQAVFVRPVTTGQLYQCTISQAARQASYTFVVCDGSGEICSRGRFSEPACGS